MPRTQTRTLSRAPLPQGGFTLTELAIVLLIVALLIGGLLVPFTAQMDLRNYAETQKTLAEIQEALYGYAASHPAADGRPHLPCPDKMAAGGPGTPNDGQEDVVAGACEVQEGNLPWVTLGITASDPWRNRFRYRVDPLFSSQTAGFALAMPASLRVCAQQACTTLLASAVPAVILSHGRNGAGGINSGTGGFNAAPAVTDVDELENTDQDNDFVSRTQTESGAAGGEFDDLAVWLPTSILVSRMIAAGRLP
jgi:prepilin-type N-terminal cleavage/methylation domain-containing protein